MAKINFSFDVSKAKKRLEGYGVLIIDEKHAKFLKVCSGNIHERDLVTALPIYEDQAGYFKGVSGGGISDESNVKREYQKRFYKETLNAIEQDFAEGVCEKLIVMCPEEDTSLLESLLKNDLKKSFSTFIEGNYIKVGINKILEKVLEYA